MLPAIIPRRKYRIPSALSAVKLHLGRQSTVVGGHTGTASTPIFFLLFFPLSQAPSLLFFELLFRLVLLCLYLFYFLRDSVCHHTHDCSLASFSGTVSKGVHLNLMYFLVNLPVL